MTQPPGDQPKIIVDEDWKTQVAREKQQQQASSRGEADNAAVPHPATAAESPARARRQPLPPASFSSLVSMLATQVLVSLGQLPMPDGTAAEVDLEHARHFIDLLQVLEDKTGGKLEPDEAKLLAGALHELRMAFVAVRSRHGET